MSPPGRRDGTAIVEIPRSGTRIGTNYSSMSAVVAALQDGKASIGRPVIGNRLLAPAFGMTVSTRDSEGAVIGALAGVMNLGRPYFLDILAKSSYGKIGGYLLVSPRARADCQGIRAAQHHAVAARLRCNFIIVGASG